jgi:hypothetical protein
VITKFTIEDIDTQLQRSVLAEEVTLPIDQWVYLLNKLKKLIKVVEAANSVCNRLNNEPSMRDVDDGGYIEILEDRLKELEE